MDIDVDVDDEDVEGVGDGDVDIVFDWLSKLLLPPVELLIEFECFLLLLLVFFEEAKDISSKDEWLLSESSFCLEFDFELKLEGGFFDNNFLLVIGINWPLFFKADEVDVEEEEEEEVDKILGVDATVDGDLREEGCFEGDFKFGLGVVAGEGELEE